MRYIIKNYISDEKMEIFIEKASDKDDIEEVDKMLTDLIQDERKYDKNINKDFVVKNFYSQFVNKEDSCIAIAKNQNQEIVGYCFAFVENNGNVYNEKIVQLDALFVKSEYRNNGIAQKLIDFVTNWSKNKGAKYIELKVCSENENAIKLYDKLEFKESKKILLKKIEK